MNSREHLATDIDRIARSFRIVSWVVWSVAAFVMIYGIPVAFRPLVDHGVPAGVAWMPSLAADAAMCIALFAAPILATNGVNSGWIGVLRWGGGLITWALQTTGSWTAEGGPDMVGVGLHSLPPLLLFLVAEGAAYFVRKMSAVLEAKRRQLASAEQKDADQRARRAELEADLRASKAEIAALTSERETHLHEIDRLTAEVTSATAAGTSTETSLRQEITRLRETNEALRADGDTRERDASEARAEEIRELKNEIRRLKAEASVPHLDARRRGRDGGANLKPSNRARFSDEEAVQRLLETPPDAAKNTPAGDVREWSQKAIVETLGIGWGRAPRLLEAVTEAQQQRAAEDRSGDQAVGQ